MWEGVGRQLGGDGIRAQCAGRPLAPKEYLPLPQTTGSP